jgi:hypothetical protein
MARGLELVSGIATAVVEIAAIAVFLFVPFPSGSESPNLGTTFPQVSAMDQGLSPLTVVLISVLLVASAGVAVGAAIHSTRGSRTGWTVLRLSCVLLLLAVLASNEGGAVFFGPGLLLALISLWAGWRAQCTQDRSVVSARQSTSGPGHVTGCLPQF